MTPNEKAVVDELTDPQRSDADLSSAIETVEVLLLTEALDPLFAIMIDSRRSMFLRRKAAKAIAFLGVEPLLSKIDQADTQLIEDEMTELIGIAMSRLQVRRLPRFLRSMFRKPKSNVERI